MNMDAVLGVVFTSKRTRALLDVGNMKSSALDPILDPIHVYVQWSMNQYVRLMEILTAISAVRRSVHKRK